MSFTLQTLFNPTEDDLRPIWDGLTRYNTQSSQLEMNRQDLCLLARNADGVVIGGLSGYLQWDWLYVDLLWVDDSQRGSGLGMALMAGAEAEAIQKGCRWSRLYTYDFQAPGFYEKLGYDRWCEMEGYPPGHTQIWYRKALEVTARTS